MKTQEQIFEYISSQEWHGSFIANLRKNRIFLKKENRNLLDDQLLRMHIDIVYCFVPMSWAYISGPFSFETTKEGEDYWFDIMDKFVEWYDTK